MNIIRPDWPAPDNVTAFTTLRSGGYSEGVFESLNIAHHVGDDPSAVSRNRVLLEHYLPAGTSIQWLSQIHGNGVIRAPAVGRVIEADASWACASGVACAVMTADCLPVLFCTHEGDKFAAAHAGWRGLNAGVLEATVAAMAVEPESIMAWMGPAIGPAAFEVGAEVRAQFLSAAPATHQSAVSQCFVSSPTRPGSYLADLYGLARIKLAIAGVSAVYGGGLCTFADKDRFYSYRRDGETGRMATVIAKTAP